MKKTFVALTLAAALTPMLSLAASTPMFDFSGGSSQFGQNFTYGFKFTPTVDIIVDSLGFFDQGADGLSVGHHVGIWNVSGTLLTSTVVSNANSSLLGAFVNGGQFRYTDIADLALSAGVTYVLGAAIERGVDVWYAAGENLSPSVLVDIETTGVFMSGDFSFPSNTLGNKYAAGSFTAREAGNAAPEPWTPALMGIAFLGLAVSRRSKSLR